MTFEQLSIFVAVAEREHLTRAAEALSLTPSAVSASIKALEAFCDVAFFQRVGRGIELTEAGRVFLDEARAVLARVRAAQMTLDDLGDLRRGTLRIHASQTIVNYWLPGRLLRFHELYPAIGIELEPGNTRTVTEAVISGAAELGFIEGAIDAPALALTRVAEDALVVAAAAGHPLAGVADLTLEDLVAEALFVTREAGSGTRSVFEVELQARGLVPRVAMVLPSNEAVLSGVRAGGCVAALPRVVVAPFVASGELVELSVELPGRAFTALRHKERRGSRAARELLAICAGMA